MMACDPLVLGFEVSDGHSGLYGTSAATDRRYPAAGLLLRQRRSQVNLHEGSKIRHEREARRLAVIRALLGPPRNLVSRIADLVALGVAKALTTAAGRISLDAALITASTDITRSLVCLVDQIVARWRYVSGPLGSWMTI
jgi:hypothetical protein